MIKVLIVSYWINIAVTISINIVIIVAMNILHSLYHVYLWNSHFIFLLMISKNSISKEKETKSIKVPK